MRSKNGGDGGTGVYMRGGTTSRVTAADRTYSKFYDFYSVSPENFGSTHVRIAKIGWTDNGSEIDMTCWRGVDLTGLG